MKTEIVRDIIKNSVYIKSGNFSLYNMIDNIENKKVREDIEVYSDNKELEEMLFLGLNFLTNPKDLIHVYSKNLVHDMRGSLNSLSSYVMILQDSIKEGVRDQLVECITYARNELAYDSALLGSDQKTILTKKEITEMLENTIKGHFKKLDYRIDGDVFSFSGDVFVVALNIIFQNIAKNLSSLAILPNKIEAVLKKEGLENILEELLFFTNSNQMYHGLAFLRFMSSKVEMRVDENIKLSLEM